MTAEIGILVYPGAQPATIHGLSDLFGIADRFAREAGAAAPSLRVTHWQCDTADAAIGCVYDSLPQAPPRPNFIIVPLTLFDPPPSEIIAAIAVWLRERHAGGIALGSVCSGALLLAATGLLDDRVASTHWSYADELSRRFPAIRVDCQIRIVDYGDVVTVGGFMAWIDMGLILIERFLGHAVAQQTANFLLVRNDSDGLPYFQGFWPRHVHADDAILRAQQVIHACDGRNVSLAALSKEAKLERRTLLRRFVKATSMTPMEYCRIVRISRARELLEFSNRSLKEIAWQLGYDDADAFARAFRRTVGQSPGTYRRSRQPAPIATADIAAPLMFAR